MNIDTPATIVKSTDEDLEAIAREIEQLTAESGLQIGKRLAQGRDIFRYRRDQGGFTGWVEDRLGYSVAAAYRLINVYERFGECFSQWETLQITALYALAAPGCPEGAIEEIAGRIDAGEKPSTAEVKETIARAKGKGGKSVEPDSNDSFEFYDWQTGEQKTLPIGDSDHADQDGVDHQASGGDNDADRHDDDNPADEGDEGDDGDHRDDNAVDDPDPDDDVDQHDHDDVDQQDDDGDPDDNEDDHGGGDDSVEDLFLKLCEMDPTDIASKILETVGATKSRLIAERLQALSTPEGKASKTAGKPFKTSMQMAKTIDASGNTIYAALSGTEAGKRPRRWRGGTVNRNGRFLQGDA